MNRERKTPIFMLLAFLVLGISTAYSAQETTDAQAPYYWTIEKWARKSVLTLSVGEQVEVKYGVKVGLSNADSAECNPCKVIATLGSCVKVHDSEGYLEEEVCAESGSLPAIFTYTKTIGPYDNCGCYTVKSSVYLLTETEEMCCDGWTIFVKVPCEYCGCSIGFWKNHREAWEPTGYDPTDLVGEVFSVPDELSELADDTLLQALEYKGGREILGCARLLLRQAVAAVLNASHPEIYYPELPDSVILDVNDALGSLNRNEMTILQGELNGYNNLGCPLN